MGYTTLNYDDYQENPDYWIGSLGIELPLWADELAERGCKSVTAIDFYDDIFGEDLEEHRMLEDYRSGEYGAIAVERVPLGKQDKKDKKKFKGKRVTVTKGNMELYNLIDKSENFCMIAPVSYAGKHRTNKNARYLYALVIEIDDIEPKHGINELFYSWRRKNITMPQPTYIVCSGTGLHLYFVFEKPIPLYQNIFEQLTEVKTYFTRLFWNKFVTNSYQPEKVQYESVNQPFRCVGTVSKSGKAYAMAFKTGKKVTIEHFNSLLPKNKQMNVIYKSKLTLAEAKELYPKWYQRRIVEKKDIGHWNRHEGIYYNWIEKIKDRENGAVVGRRYNCLENLCSLAVQCNIAPEQVEKDCRELAVYLETLTEDDDNHFTEYDILCALKTYHTVNESAYRRKLEYIENKTGIRLEANKRNYRKQNLHLKLARATRDVLQAEKGIANWYENSPHSGRKSKQEIVVEWRKNNPDGRKADCIRETGLSKPTVYKWWV